MTTTPEKPTHVWVFDLNRRVYPENRSNFSSPIYREHWVRREIIGETSRSWLTAPVWSSIKVPKTGAPPSKFLFSEDAVDDAVWADDHRYKIEREIGRISVERLRAVATVIGYRAEVLTPRL